jgi:putative ABC transport system permease protein
MNPEIVFTEETTAQEVVDVTLLPTRVGAGLLGAFGGLALLLAAVGLYGVIAYSVSRRTREVGLRMAMGAKGSDVIQMVLGSGMRLALVGIGIGAVASAFVARVLESYLYGVSALDPVAYLVAAVILLAVAGLANLIPALRASRVSPMSALRYE